MINVWMECLFGDKPDNVIGRDLRQNYPLNVVRTLHSHTPTFPSCKPCYIQCYLKFFLSRFRLVKKVEYSTQRWRRAMGGFFRTQKRWNTKPKWRVLAFGALASAKCAVQALCLDICRSRVVLPKGGGWASTIKSLVSPNVKCLTRTFHKECPLLITSLCLSFIYNY